ncbi:MauE/DoxX family redox-associated membrane protein [Flavobacterium sp. SUN052]|uniref:MauE/DoxX family redox-associated membrane protein n=1 Tax=Flavobacterium sp. SUN052 TaxID=3002441 RepID=UPI00237D497A|nr:MauE/DoxX family redox-associated membrane protein [Flavobacterium sp. SUN052]MEC4004823.1 MauE/DoxX family redox-associated membrane protein [Flavobacterium sp. SUN052]
MNPIVKFNNVLVTGISYTYIILFMYAATSKLLDFENFQIQLGQSPLLSAFAGWITILVPVTEIIIALLLSIPYTRLFALYIAYLLMVMFTAYIYIILNYSEFIPCSCGGILEKMNWNQHLIFNIIIVIAAATAILVYNPTKVEK